MGLKNAEVRHPRCDISFKDRCSHVLKYPSKVLPGGGAYNWLWIFRAAIRRYIGTEKIGNGIWNVNYRDVHLGFFDAKMFNRKEMYLKLNKDKV